MGYVPVFVGSVRFLANGNSELRESAKNVHINPAGIAMQMFACSVCGGTWCRLSDTDSVMVTIADIVIIARLYSLA